MDFSHIIDTWFSKYTIKKNDDGTVDIVLDSLKKEKRTIRIFDYQYNYLIDQFPADSISKSIQLALDRLIKLEGGIEKIIIVSQETR